MNSKALPGMEDNFTSKVIGERPSVNRSWANPYDYDFVVGMDYGKPGLFASVYNVNSKDFEKEPKVFKNFNEGLLKIPSMYPSALIVGEQSHFAVPQNETNLAQPFTSDELKLFYSFCHLHKCRFMLFPQLMNPALKSWAEFNRPRIAETHHVELPTKKGDANDARILMMFLIMENSISLALPYDEFKPTLLQDFSNDLRKDSNFILNCASKDARIYDGNGRYYKEFAIRSEELWRECGFTNKNWMKYCFSILTLMFKDPNLNETLEPHHFNDKFLRWQDFSQHVLRNTPFHFRGGRARSNIWMHFFRSFVYDYFKKARKDNSSFAKAFKADKPNSLRRYQDMLPEHQQHVRDLKKDFRRLLKKMYNEAKRKWPC